VNASEDDVTVQTLECAMKAVFASLFNTRGIDERSFARYRHDSAAMGLSVVTAYKEIGEITANAVAVTRYVADPGIFF